MLGGGSGVRAGITWKWQPAGRKGRVSPGCVFAPTWGPRGRFVEAAHSKWRPCRSEAGGRTVPDATVLRTKRRGREGRGGGRRETAKPRTRRSGASRTLGSRIPLSMSLPTPKPQTSPVSSTRKIKPESSLSAHCIATAKPLTPHNPGTPRLSLSNMTSSPRGQQNI